MKDFLASLLALWRQLGLNQRVSLGVAAMAVLAGMTALVIWTRRPDYQLLYARLGEKDAAAIISQLQAQGIPHRIGAGGTSVSVPADHVHKLRMDLASKGIPTGDGVGFEIFDKGQFGLSDFVQRTNYLRALQGELGRTISQLSGVQAARVMIVQPENRLLLTEQGVKPTASVFVDIGGGRLASDQVNAIRHLVANAVQGLNPDQVAVVDNRGHVLSEDLKQDPSLGNASSQMRYRQQVEDYLARKVESMLATVIGPGQAVVRVSAEIDTEAITSTSERFDPEGQVVRSQTVNEDSNISSEAHAAKGGAVGVSANVPEKSGTVEQAASPVSNSEQMRKNRTTTYEINRTITSTTRNPGTVSRITAAVLLAPPQPGADGAPVKRTPQEIEAVRQVVVNALGLRAQPGQPLDSIVSVHEVPFAAETVSEQIVAMKDEGRIIGWIEIARRWVPVVIAIVALLVFFRLLSRQKPEPVPVEVFSLPADMAQRTLQKGQAVTPDMLNELIRQKPANIGNALRDWVATPSKN
ncbi:MAG TPA: flagellar basal-body MS-ring/collar protein FliF [Opitutaceae bacterium]|nr:flagellar basal-body MS-ring/collar protein FliF [Opitutaceae bacterium]